ncbi:MAG: putative transporter [Ramlibacter sp.]|jgi:MFS family permease|nr:putative transporter [Ramlibacter sp.]
MTQGSNRWWSLGVLCLGVLMIVLDTTIVTVAMPAIRGDLGWAARSQALTQAGATQAVALNGGYQAAFAAGAAFALLAAALAAALLRTPAPAREAAPSGLAESLHE